MTEQEAAVQQVRETLIKSGIQFAERLRKLRSQDRNFQIAMSKSGGLAIIQTTGDGTQTKSVYRFGSVCSHSVAPANQALVDRWNRQEPNHPVELKPIQQALNEECSRIFLLIHELQKSVERTEGGS